MVPCQREPREQPERVLRRPDLPQEQHRDEQREREHPAGHVWMVANRRAPDPGGERQGRQRGGNLDQRIREAGVDRARYPPQRVVVSWPCRVQPEEGGPRREPRDRERHVQDERGREGRHDEPSEPPLRASSSILRCEREQGEQRIQLGCGSDPERDTRTDAALAQVRDRRRRRRRDGDQVEVRRADSSNTGAAAKRIVRAPSRSRHQVVHRAQRSNTAAVVAKNQGTGHRVLVLSMPRCAACTSTPRGTRHRAPMRSYTA
jgi:hypothetical protein